MGRIREDILAMNGRHPANPHIRLDVLDCHDITTAGSRVAWQRLTSRLCIFGKPSQEVPASILQLRDKPTHITMSNQIAASIEPDYEFQY